MLNKKVIALLSSSLVWFFGEGMLGPLFAIFTERVGGDVLNITWAWTAFLLMSGSLMIVFGKISDRNSNLKKRMLVAGYVLNAILTFCYLLVDNPLSLLFLQGGLGIASALATPTWNALYSKYEDKKKRGLIWGLSDGFGDIITGMGIAIGGLVVAYLSFTTLFIIMGIIQTISVILIWPILKEKTNQNP